MNCLYMDSSAVVKRYLREMESSAVFARMEAATRIGLAPVTWVEVVAALARAARAARVTRDEARDLERLFRVHWENFDIVEWSDMLAEHAARLAWRHGLRGYDAIQLAAAIRWQRVQVASGVPITFASFDVDLRRAADAEGLVVWPELPVEQPWFVADDWIGLRQDRWSSQRMSVGP